MEDEQIKGTGAEIQLPQWQSHKKVWGDKIVEVRKVGLTNREGPDDSGWRWVLSCGAIITVSLELMSRVPRVACSDSTEFALGGYYVLYEDNFEPRKRVAKIGASALKGRI